MLWQPPPLYISKLVTTGYPLLLWMSSQLSAQLPPWHECRVTVLQLDYCGGLKVQIPACSAYPTCQVSIMQPFVITSSDVPDTYCHSMSWHVDSHLSGSTILQKSGNYKGQKGRKWIKNNVNVIQLKLLLQFLSLTVPLCNKRLHEKGLGLGVF